MKKVYVTCVYELTYNDHVSRDEIIQECETAARKSGILCEDYRDKFYVVDVEHYASGAKVE